jgi:D-sedoheptulose 7-phosphate isomerase
MGVITVGLTGESGGRMKNLCDFLVNVPSLETPRIQESHIMIGHIICDFVESTIFPK